MTKKQKIKNIVKRIGLTFTALLVGVFALFGFSSKQTVNSKSYAVVPPTLTPGVVPPSSDMIYISPKDDYVMFNICGYDTDIAVNGSLTNGTKYVTIIPDYSNFSPEFSTSSEFNNEDFINSYYDDVNALSNYYDNYAVYYCLTIANISANPSTYIFNSTFCNVSIINRSTSETVLTFKSSDYSRSTLLLFNSVSSYGINLTSVCSRLNISLSEFMSNYAINFSFNISNANGAGCTIYDGLISSNYMGEYMYALYSYGNIYQDTGVRIRSVASSIYSQSNNQSTLLLYNGWFGSNDISSYWQSYYENELNANKDRYYNSGYQAGFSKGIDNATDLPGAITAFASLPFSILSGFLNFELLGFNLYALILSIVTVLLFIWIIRKIMGA